MSASVARRQQQAAAAAPPPATSMMARVDRLDMVLGYLEEMMQHSGRHHHAPSTAPAAAGAWSPSSTASSSSSTVSTPRGAGGSKTWRRRPAKEALEEAQAKGTLVDRIAFLEDRVLKMEEDMVDVSTTPEKMNNAGGSASSSKRKKGLKSLVKSCVRGKLKTKD
jgi:hypothetical protein